MKATGNFATLLVLVGTALATSMRLGIDAMPANAAMVTAAPTWPISTIAPGRPPIPTLPAGGDATPPLERIDDPVTAGASCTTWYQQSSYGGRWPATSTWWEYRCSYENGYYSNPCTSGACDGFCWYCYWETQVWTDYFYWDGSDAIFYGEAYSDDVVWEGDLAPPSSSNDWWDAPTAGWYALGPALTISTSGRGAGVVSSDPAGISCGATCRATFDPGSTVTLTATADVSSVFAGWSGDCFGTGACQVTMDQAHFVEAIFEPKTFQLTIATAGVGHGVVYLNPGGLGCSACQEPYDIGTVVTLTPSPDASSVFAGWSGDCAGTGTCQVTMDQARSVTATFARRSFTLTVLTAGSGSGHVSSDPAGIACGTTCQAGFDAGSTVTLTATPDQGSVFAGWSGDCAGTGTCQATIDQARSVTATFTLNVPPQAVFTASCTYLTCSFDGGASNNTDGAIARYAWSFGDGGSGTGARASHSYAQPGSYTVTLTVTDNAGAIGTRAITINPISLSARGYKQSGVNRVDLSWNGPSGAPFTIYRNDAKLTTVATTSYTDTVDQRRGSYTYRLCATGGTTCSNQVTVTF
jgi:PKD repeat protein